MKISLSIALFPLALFLVVSVDLARSQSSSITLDEARLEQTSISCMLKDNRTMRENFFNSVRSKHGDTKKRVRTIVSHPSGSSSQKCFSQLACPGTDVVYCFTLYHPTQTIEVCWDSQSNIINMTDYAAFLELGNFFKVSHNCRGISGPCIVVNLVPFHFDSGLLVCTSQNETCSAKEFSVINVQTANYIDPIEMSYHNSTSELVIGEQNIYYFTAEISSSNALHVSFEYHINDVKLKPIPESPFCDQMGCPIDERAGEDSDHLKLNRVRVYSYWVFQQNCPIDKFVLPIWLVIDDAQRSDVNINVVFKASLQLYFFGPTRKLTSEIGLNLTAVYPLIPLALPFDNSSGVTNESSSQLKLGESAQWTVSARGGAGDRPIWTHDGKELPLVAAVAAADEEGALCTKYNGSYYELSVHEIDEFTRNFTATLFLCNVSAHHNGYYECVVIRSRGSKRKVPLWSTQILFSPEQPAGDVTTATTSVESEEMIRPAVVTYIAVAIFIFLLLAAVAITLFLVMVCIRATRRGRFKSRRRSRRSGRVIQPPNPLGMTGAWNVDDFDGTSVDDFEFPGERLVIMNKVLGKGTFGLVLLAKAEGIVRDTPDRNMVAVKTHKVTAPEHEVLNLWEELQIMKKLKPHPHIANLLGYCRQTTSTPLYLIVEFAMYGSLKNFLKECGEVVHCLNCIPHKNDRHQSYSSSSDSPIFTTHPLDSSSKSPPTKNFNSLTLFETSGAAASGITRQTEPGHSCSCDIGAAYAASSSPARASDLIPRSSPVARDYVNSKGLLHMEDVQSFALQIASGLEHLEKEKIVHCDLAARNILISEGFVLKIGDFGMARDTSDKEYYRKSEGRIPVKWAAPETLEDHVFTHKSDIWSFGVILWEIFSYGERPYSDVKIGQSWNPFIQSLKDGQRLRRPNGCPDIFYSLMQQCWHINPDERPSASNLITSISSSRAVDHTSNNSDTSTVVMGEVMDTNAEVLVKASDDEISIRLDETGALAVEGGYCDSMTAVSDSDVPYQSLSEAEILTLSSKVTQV